MGTSVTHQAHAFVLCSYNDCNDHAGFAPLAFREVTAGAFAQVAKVGQAEFSPLPPNVAGAHLQIVWTDVGDARQLLRVLCQHNPMRSHRRPRAQLLGRM